MTLQRNMSVSDNFTSFWINNKTYLLFVLRRGNKEGVRRAYRISYQDAKFLPFIRNSLYKAHHIIHLKILLIKPSKCSLEGSALRASAMQFLAFDLDSPLE